MVVVALPVHFDSFPLSLELHLCSSSKCGFAPLSDKALLARVEPRGLRGIGLKSQQIQILVEEAHHCAQHCCRREVGKQDYWSFTCLPYNPWKTTPQDTAVMRDGDVNGK